MTSTMKAAVNTRFGGPDVFEIRDVQVPTVGSRQMPKAPVVTEDDGHSRFTFAKTRNAQ